MHRPHSETTHLSGARLAALADDELTTGEAGHICSCAVCAGELNAQRELRVLARDEALHPSVPLTRWETLAPRLQQEGLIRATPRRNTGAVVSLWVRRAAAGLVLVAGGAMVGRFSARVGGTSGMVMDTLSVGGASLGQTHDSVPIFRSPAEALATLTRAEQEYRHAAAYLVASGPSVPADDQRETYRARLAALDEMAQTTQAALADAPHDPVLNQYYISSVNAREATLRQLSGALPVGMRMDRY